MMERIWRDILERFGQDVVLRTEQGEVRLRALIQPRRDKEKTQERPGPLGLERQDRFLYMGPADCPLNPDTLVEWRGELYRVQSAHLAGEGICPHWWAMLRPRDEVAV